MQADGTPGKFNLVVTVTTDVPGPREPLYALGRLCIAAQLWGKAQSYLEASLNNAPTVDAHLALADLFERLERPGEAHAHYRAAAELSTA